MTLSAERHAAHDPDDFAGTLDNRPLLLVDADEVLLRFVERLERYLESQGLFLRLDSFRLSGNIFTRDSGAPVPPAHTKGLISDFFDACVDDIDAVPDAAAALDRLSGAYRIAILSNVPARCRDRRAAALAGHGMAFPVLANSGEKGPVVRSLADRTQGPVVFIDDLPPQVSSVAAHAPETHRIHSVADPRLARLIGKAEHAHIRLDDWTALEAHLFGLLA